MMKYKLLKQMKAKIFMLLCMFLSGISFAQTVDWDAEPLIHSIPDSLKKESAVFISIDRKVQVTFNSKNEVAYYRTSHRVVKVLDDRGIESFNKISLSPDKDGELVMVKARTITPEGKVLEVPESEIRQSKDDDGNPQYSIAFEGVEKNAELELFYVERKPFSYFGTEYISFGLPIITASFTLEVPKTIQYRFKGYNGFPNPTSLTIGDITYYRAVAHNVPAIDEEQYSNFEKNMMRIEYKINKLKDNPQEINTWQTLVEQMQKIYADFSDKELRSVSKFLKNNGLDEDASEEAKIIKIESIIKNNISYNEQLRDDQYNDLDYVISKKTTGEDGMVRLFAAALQSADVNNELGITSNYFTHEVDEDFPNWGPLDIYLFYFPNEKKYLAPSYTTLRYPVIPIAACNNKGIFIKSGDKAIADIHTISGGSEKDNKNEFTTDITFNKETLTPTLTSVNSYMGYSAFSLREAFVYVNKDKEKDLVQNLIYNAQKPENILSYNVENTGLEHYTDNKPLEIKSEVQADQLLERAGNKLLFKVGEVIGPQVEMYEDKKRVLPISMDFPNAQNRNITIEIPDGYVIKNPDAVKMNIRDDANNIGFVSDYTMDGNKMTIKINEYYYKTELPASAIDNFRKVINASADFNKITLVMEKKQ